MATKKPKVPAPTTSDLTIVFMGVINSVDADEINKSVMAIERAAKKHVPGLMMDVAHSPISNHPPLTPEQKAAVRAHVEAAMSKQTEERVVLEGRASNINASVKTAVAQFFS